MSGSKRSSRSDQYQTQSTDPRVMRRCLPPNPSNSAGFETESGEQTFSKRVYNDGPLGSVAQAVAAGVLGAYRVLSRRDESWPEALTHETGKPEGHVCDDTERAFSSHARALPRTLTRLERQLKAENEALRAQVAKIFEQSAEISRECSRLQGVDAENQELVQGAESLEHQRAAWEEAFLKCSALAATRLGVLQALVAAFESLRDFNGLTGEQYRAVGMARAEVSR